MNLQLNAENPLANKNLSSRLKNVEIIEDTVFGIASTEEGHFIVMGKNRLSNLYENKDQLIELIATKDWQLIFNMVVTLIEEIMIQKAVAKTEPLK